MGRRIFGDDTSMKKKSIARVVFILRTPHQPGYLVIMDRVAPAQHRTPQRLLRRGAASSVPFGPDELEWPIDGEVYDGGEEGRHPKGDGGRGGRCKAYTRDPPSG